MRTAGWFMFAGGGITLVFIVLPVAYLTDKEETMKTVAVISGIACAVGMALISLGGGPC